VREGNEDRYVVREERGTLLLAVADGVGGAPGGEVAADAAVHALADRFFTVGDARSVEDRLADAMRDANTAVLRAAESSEFTGAATTLVAAVVEGARVVIGNLGDSRAYLVRAGAARQLTDDHDSPIPGGITRFAGDPRGVQPDVYVEELRPADRLLLCSDGLTRHVKPDEIAATLAARTLDDGVDALVALANERGGEDNTTVLAHEVRPGGVLVPSRRALALGVFVALVVLVVGGALAILYQLAPYQGTPP
jgi:serine/threonine protein phosphatase PrpC